MRPELPSGTVTFLFTDVEGSTRLLHEHGERYADLLAEHRRLLRDAFARHGGAEVDTQGDAFFVAFARASDALAAAQEAQTALEPTPVRVRMGIHTGEPVVTEEGYVGMDVHKGARIAAAGHGGQVLVSEQAARLARVDGLVDLGPHRLKDLTAPERIFQLGEREFAPLKTLHATNLPVAASPLIGREAELEELVSLLARGARLVTVTGAGGTGKTRFALQGAAEVVEQFDDGVFWVPLQALADPALVVPTIAQTLGAKVELASYLRLQRTLLLLDNLEHLLAAAPALSELLAACPQLRLIVTSRAPLRIAGEFELLLDPLPEDEAVTLFVERARAAGRRLRPDESVAAVCRRLDCLPLALELAAARTKLLEPSALLARLDRSLPVLTGGRRDAPERQRTLRATIEWSYDLLDEEARSLFARVAVFSGSFSLDAAQEVCDADLDALAALVDLSLLKPVAQERFLMLETIREYARERLDDTAEAGDVRQRHAEHYLRLAESAHLAADSEGPQRHELVIRDTDNLRTALAWAAERGEAPFGLALTVALENFWATSDPGEGARWAAAFLERGDALSPQLRARGLRVYGGMSNVLGDADLAERLFEEGLQEVRVLGDVRGEAILLHRLASVASTRGDWPRVRELAERSLAGHRRTGFRKGETQALTHLAYVARAEGDYERALELLRESADVAEEIGFRWWLAGACADIAALMLDLDRPAEAEALARRALAVADSIADRPGVVFSLTLVAEAAAAGGDAARAARLWGAVEAHTERAPVGSWLNRQTRNDALGAFRTDARFERAHAEGRELALEDAVRHALSLD